MKNNLVDLNNYLFEVIERLTDDSIQDEQLDKEIKRAEAIRNVSETIIEGGKLALQTKKHMDEFGLGDNIAMPLLGTKS